MSLRKGIFIALVVSAAAFLAWRFVRPVNIFVVDERFERPIRAAVPEGLGSLRAEECGGCHREIYREWAGSMHAMAWEDPYFQVDFAFDGSQQICLNCHTPLEDQQEGLVLGFRDREKLNPVLEPNPEYDPALRDEGVIGAVCHVKDGKIVGPFETNAAPHPVSVDPEMTRGVKPCARCHVVSGQRWDTFYRIPPCGTVAEIKEKGQEPDCVGCHMPRMTRPAAHGADAREGGRHLFQGGHSPKRVSRALRVERRKVAHEDRGTMEYEFKITNTGAAHYLPTGTPDRHLTLEFRLLDGKEKTIKEKTYTMKRYIMWRPFIVDLRDTRLTYGEPRTYSFEFDPEEALALDVTVRYHLLDEKRRKKIGYENKDSISYPVYGRRIYLKDRGQ
jgi:hypothetical protein